MSKVKELDSESFEKEITPSKAKLSVVEFYTRTCPVCASMVAVYDGVADSMQENADFYRVDAGSNQDLAMRFGIMGVPAFKFFCKGREIAGTVGETNITALSNTVKDLVKRGTECVSKSSILRYEMDGYG